jgi:hypothetical protein
VAFRPVAIMQSRRHGEATVSSKGGVAVVPKAIK